MGLPKSKINLAIVSPIHEAYSETFITAHKTNLDGIVKFYYGGFVPTHLEGKGRLISSSNFGVRVFFKLINCFHHFESSFHWGFYRSLKKEKIDIVLAEYGQTGASIYRICQRLSIPLLVHFHGYDASQKQILEKYQEDYQEMFEYAAGIVVVSSVMRQKLIELGACEEKVFLNPYGPDDSFFAIKPNGRGSNFISLGRFINKKAPYYTIIAFSKVVIHYPKARLSMGGDGLLLSTCKNLVKALGIDDNVDFLGVLTREDFQYHLAKSCAFVQHSITAENGDMEGTPVAILESSAAGLPVISTKHAGIPEVILHNESGLLVEEHDVEGMAANMLKLLDKPEMAKQLGENGKKFIGSNFTMKHHIVALNELIDSVAISK